MRIIDNAGFEISAIRLWLLVFEESLNEGGTILEAREMADSIVREFIDRFDGGYFNDGQSKKKE